MNTGKQLIIIEKYEDFSNYIYLVLQNIPRKHGVVKEKIINLVFEKLKMFLASWSGHLRSADSWNLVKFINKEFELWKIRTQLAFR